MAATCARVKGEQEKHAVLKAKFKVRIAAARFNMQLKGETLGFDLRKQLGDPGLVDGCRRRPRWWRG